MPPFPEDNLFIQNEYLPPRAGGSSRERPNDGRVIKMFAKGKC